MGVAKNAPTPYTLGGICCTEASPEDPWAPRPGGEWAFASFGRGAAAPTRGATPGTVPGNQVAATGATNVPAILWSAWLPYRTAPAGRPKLLVRRLAPPQTPSLPIHTSPAPPHD